MEAFLTKQEEKYLVHNFFLICSLHLSPSDVGQTLCNLQQPTVSGSTHTEQVEHSLHSLSISIMNIAQISAAQSIKCDVSREEISWAQTKPELYLI